MYIVKMSEKWRIYGTFQEMGEAASAVFISLPRFSNTLVYEQYIGSASSEQR